MPVAIITVHTIASKNEIYVPVDAVMAFNCEVLSDKIPSFLYLDERPTRLVSDVDSVELSKGIRFQYVRVDEIVRLESQADSTIIYLRDKSHLVTKLALKFFLMKLKEVSFYMVHQDHLVNMSFIERLTHSSAYLTLSNFESIPVSPEQENELKNYFDSHWII